MTQHNSDRIIAVTGTAIVLILLALSLMTYYYRVQIYPPEDRKWPPVDSSEIVFGGEYVKLGDIPLPQEQTDNQPLPENNEAAPAVDAMDMADAGKQKVEEPVKVVQSKRESPMKVKENPKTEKRGPSAEELLEQERKKREQEQAEQQAQIANRMKSGFGKSASGSGTSGSTNGNSTTGALSGAPGHNLKGRTAESWGRPRSTKSGTIQVRVSVNPQGQVISARYVGGTGPAAADPNVRNSCVEASRNSKFSVDLDGAANQSGVITWKFE